MNVTLDEKRKTNMAHAVTKVADPFWFFVDHQA